MSRAVRLLAAAGIAALAAAACAGSQTLDGLRTATSTTSSTTVPVDGRVGPDAVDGAIPAGIAPDPDPTPLPIDDDYRIGTLDNGLTYLLRSNDSPGLSLDLRLVVDAGSLQQDIADDGSAHFLEHMLFNGTERYPGNELGLQLQRLGIEFGPELNAFTTYDETVYLLGATTIDPAAPEIAFDVLAQWASAALIEPQEVTREIGVVRDELRQASENVDGFMLEEFDRIYTAGTPYAGHLPIGEAAKVEATTAENLRSFYERWYRPDNMAVVVVGDLPLDLLEEMVIEHFEGLAQPSTPLERTPVEIDLAPEPVTAVITHPNNAIDNISLDLPLPVWDRATVGGDRLTLMETVIAVMVENRLGDAFQRGDLVLDGPPFFGEFSINRGLRYFGTNLQAGDLEAALEGYLAELFGAAAGGFDDDELTRARTELLAVLDDEEAGLGAVQDWQFAGELMSWWLDSADLSDGRDRIARRRNLLGDLTPEELSGHWRWLLESAGPIVIAVGSDPAALPSTARLGEILAATQPSDLGDSGRLIDALMEPPEPVDPVRSEVERNTTGDVHRWEFPNGVHVSFQESTIAEGFVELRSAGSGGWSTFPPGHPAANAAVPELAVDAVLGSGLGAHDAATLERFLESRAASVSVVITETEEELFGGAARDDVEVLFQLIHLLGTEPRVDDVAFRTAINGAEQAIAFQESDVDARARAALSSLLTGDDPRFLAVPTTAQLADATPEILLGVFRARLGAVDDLHVAVVGDVDAGTVEVLAARYLATLPERAPDGWVDLGIDFPVGLHTAEVVLPDGAADGGLQVVHHGAMAPDPTIETAATVLQAIIDTRITEVIREDLGASYGGFSVLTPAREGHPGITSSIRIDGDPTRLGEIRAALRAILTDLAVRGPSTDEFDRAVKVIGDGWAFVDNPTFLRANLDTGRFPDVEHLTPDNRADVLTRLRPVDVRELAAALYGDDDWVEVAKVLP